MIKVIGKIGCEGCSTTKEFLENEGIEFEYHSLDELDNASKREYIKIARDADQAFFPIIFKDGKLVSIPDYQSKKYLEGVKTNKVIKRDKSIVGFNKVKIANAVIRAMSETDKGEDEDLAKIIANEIFDKYKIQEKSPTVEEVQDTVEELLALYGRFDVSKKYILYREDRAKIRGGKLKNRFNFLTNDFLSKYKHKDDPFTTELGKFVYYRTYSRPIPQENRRERWWETVARVVDFSTALELEAYKKQNISLNLYSETKLRAIAEEMYDLMYNFKLFPSGRSLWVGGTPSSKQYPLSNFNCSFVVIDSLIKFSEIFSLLMLGTGAGLSVERKYIKKLPKINKNIEIIHKDYRAVPKKQRKEYTELLQPTRTTLQIVIGDSKFGWSKSMEMYLDILSSKQYADVDTIIFNYDNIRPAGEILKTFGGRASGHIAIQNMFEKIDLLFKTGAHDNNKQWQTIMPIDALDIATIIAENVVSGGVRRSALIVFCDNDEKEVLEAKSKLYYQDDSGEWVSNEKILHRALSNNTVFYNEKPTREQLHNQFQLIRTSGEPSFGNMAEMKRRRPDVQGGNPCFEIMLRDRGVCNLTEVNMMAFVRADGTFDKTGMLEAQRMSARVGYRMATVELELNEWNLVNVEDRLIGCSLTGMMDFANATGISRDDLNQLMAELRETAHEAANELADTLGMNRPKLYTCIKPSGTISQLPTVSSGVHFSHSPYYLRRVRVSAKDPVAIAMADVGFTWYPENGTTVENHTSKVFEFPIKAPEGRTKYDVGAIEQLELYKDTMEFYTDHNSSNTIHVRENEWDLVEEWVYNNWDVVVGITFISLDDSFYQLMPYESITKEQYEVLLAKAPVFNPSMLLKYENFTEEFELEADCDSGVCPIR